MQKRKRGQVIEKINNLNEWEQKVRKADVLVFDLDGTLINTDYANFLSYKAAIEQIIQPRLNLYFNPSKRITREVIRAFVPDISEENFKKIIKIKESLYSDYLHETKLNREIADILDRFQNKDIVLVTNSRRKRVSLLLTHHDITDKFTHKYYRENMTSTNKFQHVLSVLQISGSFVVVFENNESQIELAISAGVPAENILKVV